jgi:hypothetical protein
VSQDVVPEFNPQYYRTKNMGGNHYNFALINVSGNQNKKYIKRISSKLKTTILPTTPLRKNKKITHRMGKNIYNNCFQHW